MAKILYKVFELPDYPGEWVAEAIDADGRILRAVFDYTDAKARAEEYAQWQNNRMENA